MQNTIGQLMFWSQFFLTKTCLQKEENGRYEAKKIITLGKFAMKKTYNKKLEY